MAGPLEGTRVVDLSQVVSGPWATMLLADQGAELSETGNDAAWERMEEADSLLALAEDIAPEWVEPTIDRGWLAFQPRR